MGTEIDTAGILGPGRLTGLSLIEAGMSHPRKPRQAAGASGSKELVSLMEQLKPSARKS